MRSAIAGDADPLHRLVGAPLGDAARRHLGGRRPHIVARREAVEHVGHLRLDADAQAGDGVRADAGDRRAAEQDLAAGRPQLAGQAFEEGAFARAVGPDHAAQLDLAQGEVDMVDGHDAAEAHGQAPCLEERGRRHGFDVRSRAAGSARGARPRGEACQRPPAVGHQRGQALGHQQDEDHQQDAQHQVGIDPAEAFDLAQGAEIVGQDLHQDAADHRSDQRAEAADDDPDDDLAAHRQAEHGRAHEHRVGEQQPREARPSRRRS